MATSDPASKERTMTHMNKEHTEDLSLYLRHFSGLSSSAAADSPRMTDIDERSMTIATASGGTHVIPFSPPMASWADRRTRLVDMSMEARQALGLSGGARFKRPAGADLISFFGVLFYWTSWGAVRAGLVKPGTAPWRLLEAVRFPGGPAMFTWLTETIFVPVVAIHVAEAWWLDRTRLAPAGVKRLSVDWLLWMSSCFIEGVPSFLRFDRNYGAKKTGSDVQKH